MNEPAARPNEEQPALSPSRAAEWLQRSIDRDETRFRRRRAVDALDRLRAASESLAYRVDGNRGDLLLGRRSEGANSPSRATPPLPRPS